MTRIAILDDSQNVALQAADWATLRAKGAAIDVLHEPMTQDEAAERLAGYDVLVPMRERTPFPATLLSRLPKLKLIALTGARSPSLDIVACTNQGVIVCNTGGGEETTASTAELTWALLLAAVRSVPKGNALMHAGGWHEGLSLGQSLEGKRLGIVGLGKLGQRVAQYGDAFGMDVVAWSQNLTDEAAAAARAKKVTKAELFATSDAVSLHLVLSDRTRNIVGAAELGAMKPGAVLVNTSRGALVNETALLDVLNQRKIIAALDVYAREPVPVDDPIRSAPNTVLMPHQGYSAWPTISRFYGDSVENILAWLDGAPVRVMNPDAVLA